MDAPAAHQYTSQTSPNTTIMFFYGLAMPVDMRPIGLFLQNIHKIATKL